jgi:hypothetical protein
VAFLPDSQHPEIMAHMIPPLNNEEPNLQSKLDGLNDPGFKHFNNLDRMESDSLNQPILECSAKSLPICRICLSEQDDDIKNPLISPCKCCGTMSTVHARCLRSWLDSKKETRETDSTSSFQWTIIRCELCHTVYPREFLIDGKFAINLFEYNMP